jgi:hypothetical protein
LIVVRGRGQNGAELEETTVMNAQEMAPKFVDQEQRLLPLPTADMNGDDAVPSGHDVFDRPGRLPDGPRLGPHDLQPGRHEGLHRSARLSPRDEQEMEREEIAEAQKAARRYIDAGVVKLAA